MEDENRKDLGLGCDNASVRLSTIHSNEEEKEDENQPGLARKKVMKGALLDTPSSESLDDDENLVTDKDL